MYFASSDGQQSTTFCHAYDRVTLKRCQHFHDGSCETLLKNVEISSVYYMQGNTEELQVCLLQNELYVCFLSVVGKMHNMFAFIATER